MRKFTPMKIAGILILLVALGLSLFKPMAMASVPKVGILYTDLEKVSSDLMFGETLNEKPYHPVMNIRPHQVVSQGGKVYCLGQRIDGVNGLYSLNLENGHWAELKSDVGDLGKSTGTIWDDLQCVGGQLIWDQYSGEDDYVSDKRFCLDIETGEERKAAFRHGKMLWWEGNFYKFSLKKLYMGDLVTKSKSGNIETVAKDMFHYQDSEMLIDGMVGYLPGHGNWAFRYNLSKQKTVDKLEIKGTHPTVIQSSADYMMCMKHDGSVFVYFYDSGMTYCVREADEHPPHNLTVELRTSSLWMINGKEISMLTLPELEMRRVEATDFTDYYVTEEGVLILCDMEGISRYSVNELCY